MKRTVFAAAIIVMLTAGTWLTGCNRVLIAVDSGPLTTKEYSFGDFSAVDVGSAFKVDIIPADSFSVKVTAGENLFKNIKVVKTGSTLKIYIEDWHFTIGDQTLEARITMPGLQGLNLSGAAKGTVKGFRSGHDFSAEISGASTLDMDMETGNFTGEISGASKVTARLKSTSADIGLSGAGKLKMDIETGSFVDEISGASEAAGSLKAASTTLDITGASKIQLSGSGGNLKLTGSGASEAVLAGFKIQDADITLSGASHADLDIDGKLNVSLSGASELVYGGNPILGDRLDVTGGSKLQHR